MKPSPPIVVLCGSTRFRAAFEEASRYWALRGWICLSVGFFGHGGDGEPTPEQKEALDELHKRKIDLADLVHVLDVNGYIGSSTQSEIAYASKQGTEIRYLSAKSCCRYFAVTKRPGQMYSPCTLQPGHDGGCVP